jgi:hypothetical protein
VAAPLRTRTDISDEVNANVAGSNAWRFFDRRPRSVAPPKTTFRISAVDNIDHYRAAGTRLTPKPIGRYNRAQSSLRNSQPSEGGNRCVKE